MCNDLFLLYTHKTFTVQPPGLRAETSCVLSRALCWELPSSQRHWRPKLPNEPVAEAQHQRHENTALKYCTCKREWRPGATGRAATLKFFLSCTPTLTFYCVYNKGERLCECSWMCFSYNLHHWPLRSVFPEQLGRPRWVSRAAILYSPFCQSYFK